MFGRDPLARLRREIMERLPGTVRERISFYETHGRLPDLNHPTTFNEKVVCRKLFDGNPLFALYSDKLAVRHFVAYRVGGHVLVPLIASTATPRELLDLSDWRNAVFKPNHGSRMVMIFGDEQPDHATREAAVDTFEQWLKRDYRKVYNERHYSSIPPQMMVERFVGHHGHSPAEWKVHCFRQEDGTIRFILQVISDRFGKKAISYHDIASGHVNLIRSVEGIAPDFGAAKEAMLEDVLANTRELAHGFDYVRVDWFITRDRSYFSEMTFTPGAGLSTTLGRDLDRRMGALWLDGGRGPAGRERDGTRSCSETQAPLASNSSAAPVATAGALNR